MDKPNFIMVTGVSSKEELRIDLDVLSLMLKVFLQDSPREAREPEKVVQIMEFYRKVTDLLNAEIEAAERIVKEKLLNLEVEDAINKTDDVELMDTFEDNMLKFYHKEE